MSPMSSAGRWAVVSARHQTASVVLLATAASGNLTLWRRVLELTPQVVDAERLYCVACPLLGDV
jgi:hypothetical protein